MIMYVGAAESEKQAQQAIKKYGDKYTTLDPNDPNGALWNGAVAMVAGCKLISGYQGGVPTFHSLYWMNLLSSTPDNALYNDVAGVGAPIIEFDFARSGATPSAFITRQANLPAQMTPFDDKVLGITPIWAGSPDMGWLYDT